MPFLAVRACGEEMFMLTSVKSSKLMQGMFFSVLTTFAEVKRQACSASISHSLDVFFSTAVTFILMHEVSFIQTLEIVFLVLSIILAIFTEVKQ